jgi:hypothetical protein
MPNAVYAAMLAEQTAVSEPPLDLFEGDARFQKLPASDDAVLEARDSAEFFLHRPV